METITKPYYKYKKDAYKKLSETILGMLKRVNSLDQVIDFEFATYEDLKLFISFSESKLASIDIYYQGGISVGVIILPNFEYDSVRFYVYSDHSGHEYEVVLDEIDIKDIVEESLTLYKYSQSSSDIFPEGHVTVTSSSLTVVYIESDEHINHVIYRN